MADDLSHLSDVSDMGGTDNMHIPGHTTTTSAHAVMIARGPLQCVVAQYFVERCGVYFAVVHHVVLCIWT